MFKKLGISLALSILFITCISHASERSIETYIDSRAVYNDNIFLTNQPHDSVKGLIITPTLSGVIKEQSWESELRARLRVNKYSDNNLNSNDQLFDLTGRYIAERNIFSLNINHNFESNLSSDSTDFGIVGKRINRKTQSITPQYTRLLSERTVLTLSYTYSDVDFLEAEDTGFTAYIVGNASASFVYDLTESDKLTLSLIAVDYTSRDELVTYQLFMTRFGIDHKFSETLSTDLLVGVSRRESTNRQTQSYDFFGDLITRTQEIDFSDRGLVLNAGIKWLFKSGQIEGRISRDNTTNSFGGLDEINSLKINYADKLSELWRYKVSGHYEDVTSISSGGGNSATDREILYFESVAFYSISNAWNINVSYRYASRKFKSDAGADRAPNSSRIYIGLTYSFPTLSTF